MSIPKRDQENIIILLSTFVQTIKLRNIHNENTTEIESKSLLVMVLLLKNTKKPNKREMKHVGM